MDYSALSGCYAAVIDKELNTVYVADPRLLQLIWQEEVDDLDEPKSSKRARRKAICCRGHLIPLVHSWLWQHVWRSWSSGKEAQDLAVRVNGIEPTCGVGVPAYRVDASDGGDPPANRAECVHAAKAE